MRTIAAVSTPPGVGGIAVIRISGDEAFCVTDRIFSFQGAKRLFEIPANSVVFGRIIDENNDVVFSTDHHSLHNPNEEFEPEYWNGFSMHTEKISENQLRMYVTSSGSEQTFPRSQKLYISFKRIATRRNPKDGSFLENKNEDRIIYLGDWKFEADVPENMYKRESTSYKAVKCNEIGIDLSTIEAELSNTAFKLNMGFSPLLQKRAV